MEAERHSDSDIASEKEKGLNRRKFLTYSAGAGAGLMAFAAGSGYVARVLAAPPARATGRLLAAPETSRVIVTRCDSLFAKGKGPEKKQVGWMLDAGIRNLFDVQDSAKVWRGLFSPDDVVGIKVNCIAGPNLSTHPRIVSAIVSELEKVPIPRERIIIWDRTNRELIRAGYSINLDKPGVRCYGTDAVGHEDKASGKGSFNGRLSKILTRQITALINVPILKNHGGAGVTIAMKNHYGSFHNPGRHHGNMCDPYMADLNSLDEIRAKTKLIVCDAARAACNGGPGYKPAFVWQYSGLLLSCDPVALDTVGTKIIDERRTEVGLPTLAEAGRHPRCLASAAERGLGNAEMRKIDLRTVTIRVG
ncbi:MAG: DUF362 domain-containing protein [Candidatus Hydrogenedentota bacterium]|nr:MAG: DUF362 domain-containing protein [Candidatus Hydrogenedentota bacterium]